jgi:hypothetical protein
MILCDSCDRGYHVACLKLNAVPEGRWLCPRRQCGGSGGGGVASSATSENGGVVHGRVSVTQSMCCTICQYNIEDLSLDTPLRELHCGHIFCEECIKGWFAQGRNSCPNCSWNYSGLRNSKSQTVGALLTAARTESTTIFDAAAQKSIASGAAGETSNRKRKNNLISAHATSPEECNLQVTAQNVRRRYSSNIVGAFGVTTSKSKPLRRLQKACTDAGLWAGGHVADLCTRLARHELRLPALLLDQVRQTFQPKVCVKMLFSDNKWYRGWVLTAPDDAGCIDIFFEDGEEEEQVPLMVAGALNPEVQSLEADINTVVCDILEAMMDTIEQASPPVMVADTAIAVTSQHISRQNTAAYRGNGAPITCPHQIRVRAQASHFLNRIKASFGQDTYNELLEILRPDLQSDYTSLSEIDVRYVRIVEMFEGRPEVMAELKQLLPERFLKRHALTTGQQGSCTETIDLLVKKGKVHGPSEQQCSESVVPRMRKGHGADKLASTGKDGVSDDQLHHPVSVLSDGADEAMVQAQDSAASHLLTMQLGSRYGSGPTCARPLLRGPIGPAIGTDVLVKFRGFTAEGTVVSADAVFQQVFDGSTGKLSTVDALAPSEFLVFFAEDGEYWKLDAAKHKHLYVMQEVESNEASTMQQQPESHGLHLRPRKVSRYFEVGDLTECNVTTQFGQSGSDSHYSDIDTNKTASNCTLPLPTVSIKTEPGTNGASRNAVEEVAVCPWFARLR